MNRLSWTGLMLAILISPVQASDWPMAKDHEYNMEKPGPLKGHMETLKTDQGEPFQVYTTGKPDARRAILVIHEWWGLNDHIKAWADRFAAMGMHALAIDLYNGKAATDPKEAGALMKAVDQDAANRKLKAALTHLKKKGVSVATIGWCFGGGQSLQATLQAPEDVSATVIYYGMPVMDVDKLKTIQGPVLGIYAAQDGWITPEKVAAFQKAMLDAGKSLEVHSFDAQHAFANPSGQRYNSQAAKDAWKITKEFLMRNLK